MLDCWVIDLPYLYIAKLHYLLQDVLLDFSDKILLKMAAKGKIVTLQAIAWLKELGNIWQEEARSF